MQNKIPVYAWRKRVNSAPLERCQTIHILNPISTFTSMYGSYLILEKHMNG